MKIQQPEVKDNVNENFNDWEIINENDQINELSG
jgi:hypothetical protein